MLNKLSKLRDRDILTDIDFEWCRVLLKGHPDLSEHVMLAACLASYLYRQGDVCVPLDRYAGKALFTEDEPDYTLTAPDLDRWLQSLVESRAVGQGGEFKPLILEEENRLYLHKLWTYEQVLAQNILQKARIEHEGVNIGKLKPTMDKIFGDGTEDKDPNLQKLAAAASLLNNLTVISGGPGTGKTTTVARILVMLIELYRERESEPAIAMAAPTGKAAARLEESIRNVLTTMELSDEDRALIPDEARTVHQLMGARRHSSRFRYHSENPLPYDVVIVDEASMIAQGLMSKLTEALRPETRLIMLGDKDQLASVEAGSVLGDICASGENLFSASYSKKLTDFSLNMPEEMISPTPEPLTNNIILLKKSYRFKEGSGILELSHAVNSGEDSRAAEVLDSPAYDKARFIEINTPEDFEKQLREIVETYFSSLMRSRSAEGMFKTYRQFRMLTAHRKGPLGVKHLNSMIERFLWERGAVTKFERWYHGKPVIVNRNDYALGLNNGDIGMCVMGKGGDPQLYFEKEGGYRTIDPARLPDHTTAFALTVHKSQGSEFEHIFLVLPAQESRVLSRELIYTAITRARQSITIGGRKEIFRQGVARKLNRTSGLKGLIWS